VTPHPGTKTDAIVRSLEARFSVGSKTVVIPNPVPRSPVSLEPSAGGSVG
jgi:hypothetical protein